MFNIGLVWPTNLSKPLKKDMFALNSRKIGKTLQPVKRSDVYRNVFLWKADDIRKDEIRNRSLMILIYRCMECATPIPKLSDWSTIISFTYTTYHIPLITTKAKNNIVTVLSKSRV